MCLWGYIDKMNPAFLDIHVFLHFLTQSTKTFKSSINNTRKNCMLEKLLLNLDNRKNYGIVRC